MDQATGFHSPGKGNPELPVITTPDQDTIDGIQLQERILQSQKQYQAIVTEPEDELEPENPELENLELQNVEHYYRFRTPEEIETLFIQGYQEDPFPQKILNLIKNKVQM